MGGLIWEALEWGRGLIWYGACNGGPGVVRNVPNPAQNFPPIHTSDMSC